MGREDTAGWKMDTYQTTLNWLNLKTQEEISLNEAQAREQLIDSFGENHLKSNREAGRQG